MTQAQLLDRAGRRYRQVRNLWREGGMATVWQRACRAAAGRLGSAVQHMPVHPEDVMAADLTASRRWPVMRCLPIETMVVNWVTTPPAVGSGGHTTMFRLIEYLERSGHHCRVYIYDVFGNDLRDCEALVRRNFPGFKGPVHEVRSGMAPADAVVATSWPTAYPVYNDPCAGKRFYLVQDFEPWFYPVGGLSALAENTYRMGFHAITAGRFLAEKLASEYGMRSAPFAFGCDTQTYHRLDAMRRDGVVFYAKPGAPRRAFELGIMALELLMRRNSDLTVHFYGESTKGLPFPYVNHGVVRPEQLNDIYNRCFAGLSLSMTNVSLVPYEMLASGCIPVVNEARHNRIVLDNPHVRYAAASPHALAQAMHEVVTAPEFDRLANAASASIGGLGWDDAGIAVEKFIQREIGTDRQFLEPYCPEFAALQIQKRNGHVRPSRTT